MQRLQAAAGDTAAYQYAQIYAQWGRLDESVKWLRKAYELRDPGFVALKKDIFLEPIQRRPEFLKIRAALKYPE
jgi:hypothetical protein